MHCAHTGGTSSGGTDASHENELGEAIYVGRNPKYGQTRFGNRAARSKGRRTREVNEGHVCAYAAWLGRPEQADLRAEIKRRLKGHLLVCHCAPLPCHAEVIAALANEPLATMPAICGPCE